MAKTDILTVLTNIPLTLERLKFADHSLSEKAKAEGWGPQIKLTGTKDGKDVSVYLPGGCLNDLVAQGIVEDTGELNNWGSPTYKVLKHDPITILRTEEGKKKLTQINPNLTNGAMSPAKARVSGPQKAPAPVKPTKAPEAGERNTPQDWNVLEATYAECVRIAKRTLEASFGTDIGLSDTGLIAATATLFIECNKRGLKALPPAKPPRPLSEMPAPLSEADDEMPWEVSR